MLWSTFPKGYPFYYVVVHVVPTPKIVSFLLCRGPCRFTFPKGYPFYCVVVHVGPTPKRVSSLLCRGPCRSISQKGVIILPCRGPCRSTSKRDYESALNDVLWGIPSSIFSSLNELAEGLNSISFPKWRRGASKKKFPPSLYFHGGILR